MGLSICLSDCLSVAKMQKNAIFSKLSNLELRSLDDDLYKKSYQHSLFKEPIIGFGSLKFKMAEIRHLENEHDVIFLPWAVRFG